MECRAVMSKVSVLRKFSAGWDLTTQVALIIVLSMTLPGNNFVGGVVPDYTPHVTTRYLSIHQDGGEACLVCPAGTEDVGLTWTHEDHARALFRDDTNTGQADKSLSVNECHPKNYSLRISNIGRDRNDGVFECRKQDIVIERYLVRMRAEPTLSLKINNTIVSGQVTIGNGESLNLECDLHGATVPITMQWLIDGKLAMTMTVNDSLTDVNNYTTTLNISDTIRIVTCTMHSPFSDNQSSSILVVHYGGAKENGKLEFNITGGVFLIFVVFFVFGTSYFVYRKVRSGPSRVNDTANPEAFLGLIANRTIATISRFAMRHRETTAERSPQSLGSAMFNRQNRQLRTAVSHEPTLYAFDSSEICNGTLGDHSYSEVVQEGRPASSGQDETLYEVCENNSYIVPLPTDE